MGSYKLVRPLVLVSNCCHSHDFISLEGLPFPNEEFDFV